MMRLHPEAGVIISWEPEDNFSEPLAEPELR
jgi:hypothetical protein